VPQVNPEQWLSNEKAQMSLLVPSWVPSKMPLTHVPPMSTKPEADLTPPTAGAEAAQAVIAGPDLDHSPSLVGFHRTGASLGKDRGLEPIMRIVP